MRQILKEYPRQSVPKAEEIVPGPVRYIPHDRTPCVKDPGFTQHRSHLHVEKLESGGYSKRSRFAEQILWGLLPEPESADMQLNED